MELFKTAMVRGIMDRLMDSGHLRFPSEKVANAVCSRIASALEGPADLPSTGLDKESAAVIFGELKTASDFFQQHNIQPDAASQQFAKQAAAAGWEERAAFQAAALMKMAEDSVMADTGNSLAEAARVDTVAELDAKNRPAGAYVAGPGETQMPNGGAVGRQMPHPNSDDPAVSNPMTALDKQADDLAAAALGQQPNAAAEEVDPGILQRAWAVLKGLKNKIPGFRPSPEVSEAALAMGAAPDGMEVAAHIIDSSKTAEEVHEKCAQVLAYREKVAYEFDPMAGEANPEATAAVPAIMGREFPQGGGADKPPPGLRARAGAALSAAGSAVWKHKYPALAALAALSATAYGGKKLWDKYHQASPEELADAAAQPGAPGELKAAAYYAYLVSTGSNKVASLTANEYAVYDYLANQGVPEEKMASVLAAVSQDFSAAPEIRNYAASGSLKIASEDMVASDLAGAAPAEGGGEMDPSTWEKIKAWAMALKNKFPGMRPEQEQVVNAAGAGLAEDPQEGMQVMAHLLDNCKTAEELYSECVNVLQYQQQNNKLASDFTVKVASEAAEAVSTENKQEAASRLRQLGDTVKNFAKTKGTAAKDFVRTKGTSAWSWAKDNPKKSIGGAAALTGTAVGLDQIRRYYNRRQAAKEEGKETTASDAAPVAPPVAPGGVTTPVSLYDRIAGAPRAAGGWLTEDGHRLKRMGGTAAAALALAAALEGGRRYLNRDEEVSPELMAPGTPDEAKAAAYLKAAAEGSIMAQGGNSLAAAASVDTVAELDKKNRAAGAYSVRQGATSFPEGKQEYAMKAAHDLTPEEIEYVNGVAKIAEVYGSQIPQRLTESEKTACFQELYAMVPSQRPAFIQSLRGG